MSADVLVDAVAHVVGGRLRRAPIVLRAASIRTSPASNRVRLQRSDFASRDDGSTRAVETSVAATLRSPRTADTAVDGVLVAELRCRRSPSRTAATSSKRRSSECSASPNMSWKIDWVRASRWVRTWRRLARRASAWSRIAAMRRCSGRGGSGIGNSPDVGCDRASDGRAVRLRDAVVERS